MVENFGVLPGGQTVERLKITGYGLSAHILTFGAILQDLRLDTVPYPLILGYNNLAAYLKGTAYFGAIVGRCANRIDKGTAVIGGTAFQFDCNENETHTLHGGREGSDNRRWRVAHRDQSSLTLVDILPDGHMGFPGEMTVNVHYKSFLAPHYG